ncbi:MAG: dihydroneopterin aldolase [Gracilimonas sp.]|uniref:dihydroneopterin aldolase n=1 Tax=Gracilimonas sp. TaxID=1974203 RepID=UPI0019C67205|nr:dihydroneopterin aldolase [Gracilimonas sp.]MBD3616831.1 dihydroneopterin aldolase [Gracilimonas sp.]
MDTLTIKGMKFRAFHGVHEHEKKEGNDFEVDVTFHADLSVVGKSDQISDAIDYTKVHEITSEIMGGKSVDLIEHLCFRIGNDISKAFPGIDQLEVAVRKLSPPLSSETKYTEARMSWPM